MNGCVSLWIGPRLGAVERACLRSVMRQGHGLTLYCYDPPSGVPEGVRLADASEIVPRASVFRQRGGSVAHFSDWFRYALQRAGRGTWVDTDIYLLRPLDTRSANLFGEEAPGCINNAVLRLPPDSPLLAELLRPFDAKTTPDWLPLRHYLSSRLLEVVTGRADLGRLPWGSTGPQAITKLARKFALSSEARPQDEFYPVGWREAAWILDPKVALEDVTTPGTVAVHLWNECIRTYKDAPAPAGSFLQRLQVEGA